MKLLRLENFLIKFEDELLALTPFKLLCKKDKSRDKKEFVEFLTILYFTYDPRSDYSHILNDNDRLKEVCITNGFKVPKFDELLKSCVELYKKLTNTVTQELLQSTKIAINKVRDFLENVDLNQLDDKGKPVYTINSITTAIKLIPLLAKDVMEAERVVTKELEEHGRARGNNAMSLMDDGIFA